MGPLLFMKKTKYIEKTAYLKIGGFPMATNRGLFFYIATEGNNICHTSTFYH
ncbi:hypothetical protein PthBH41_02870 [Parageobacillus thermoglucosidasius]|nr:hypothetical protein PthBH41_02870 [Parageobacillus thermoglucosidasius]GAJ43991.1 hypothetical protein GT2_14_00040 [Parageobacillus thermoglucosidasius NBRC 107763]